MISHVHSAETAALPKVLCSLQGWLHPHALLEGGIIIQIFISIVMEAILHPERGQETMRHNQHDDDDENEGHDEGGHMCRCRHEECCGGRAGGLSTL